MIRILIMIFSCFQFLLLSAQNYDAELISQETNILIRNGKLNKSISYEIKINNRTGEKFADVSIPYSKMIKVSKIEACLKDKNGTIIKKLKKSDISDRSEFADFSFYEDNFVKEFTLKHNIFPYYIYFKYQEQQDDFLYIDQWYPVLDPEIPTDKANLTLEIPKNFKIFYTNQKINEFKMDTSNELIKYTWRTSYKDLVKLEIYTPPIAIFLPNVIIFPKEFYYESKGYSTNWITYGNWEYGLIKDLMDLPENEKNKIQLIINGVDDERGKIKKLYYYLQDQTRYINISITTGGLKPYPAAYVAENKFGDCKALTNYFKSVLNCIGVNSIYTNVHAGGPITLIDKNLPSQQFNHVILCVPVKQDTIWLDCTSDGPFNYLGTFTQNRNVFLIDKDKSHFTRTPSLSKFNVLETRSIKINPDQNNEVIANFYNTYKGENYEYLFFMLNTQSELKINQMIRDKFIEYGFEAINIKLNKLDRDSSRIDLSYSAKPNKLYNKYGNELLINLIPFSVPQFESPNKRKLPVQMDYPIYKIDTLVYFIPKGYIVSNKLRDHIISNEFGQYKIMSFQEKDKIHIIKTLFINSGNWEVADYKNIYEFVHGVNEFEKETYIVTIKQD